MKRIAQIVHASPGRLRLRMAWLRSAPGEAGALSEGLSKIHGVEQIEIRPYTGSVLCLHDPWVIGTDALLEEIRRAATLERMLRPGDEVPLDGMDAMMAQASAVGRSVSNFFRDLNRDLMRSSEGRLDLGTATGLTFVVAAAAKVAATRKLSMPAWFDFGWWAYRTLFLTSPVAEEQRNNVPEAREGESPLDARVPH